MNSSFAGYLGWEHRLFAPCKGIQDNPGFWIPRRGSPIPIVSGIPDILELHSGFKSPGSNSTSKISRIPDTIHRIHKWRTRGKKLVPSHESEALEDKQKLQMKTFSELAECLARIPPKITFYGLLFKYNYVGCLLLLIFSSDLLFAIKRDAYIVKETEWFCRFPKPSEARQVDDGWRKAANMSRSP